MAETTQGRSRAHRYLTVLMLIILVIVVAVIADKLITFIITRYLPEYDSNVAYVAEGFNALLGIFGAYVVYRVLLSILNMRGGDLEAHRSQTGKVILRVLFYITVLTILLIAFGPALGITLSQSLAGGAIGGIVIGLALQTIVTSMIAGFFVSSSKTLVPGEVVVLHSSIWGGDLICKVVKVNILFTEVITQAGNREKIPNAPFVSNVTFTKLKNGSRYVYMLQISSATDVSATELYEKAKVGLKENFSKIHKTIPEMFMAQRTSSLSAFNVMVHFDDFSEINQILHVANETFDQAYWDLKNPKQPKRSKRK